MAIKLTVKLGGEIFEVIVNQTELLFYSINSQSFTTIKGLKISKGGVLKEFPDLEDNPNWKDIALERLKEKMNSYQTEREKLTYVMNELLKFGYQILFYQRAGGRPTKIKNGIII